MYNAMKNVNVWAFSGDAAFDCMIFVCDIPITCSLYRPFVWPMGRVLGGSSCMHFMTYIRGHAFDYDRWEREGAEGWSYADCLPYFNKSQTHELGKTWFSICVPDFQLVVVGTVNDTFSRVPVDVMFSFSNLECKPQQMSTITCTIQMTDR